MPDRMSSRGAALVGELKRGCLWRGTRLARAASAGCSKLKSGLWLWKGRGDELEPRSAGEREERLKCGQLMGYDLADFGPT